MQLHSKLQLPGQVHVIGCGGIGSWLSAGLVRLAGDDTIIHLWDGDSFEQNNIDRQLFDRKFIGRNKAEATVEILSGEEGHWDRRDFVAHPEYFHSGSEVGPLSVILCCADNHAARSAALSKCDEEGKAAIIGANEYTDAEAYIYLPFMRGTSNDPRVFYPDILSDRAGDPRSPAGCVGAIQQENRQLVIANQTAAALMLRLMWWWFAEARELDHETMPKWPVLHGASASTCWTVKLQDRTKQ